MSTGAQLVVSALLLAYVTLVMRLAFSQRTRYDADASETSDEGSQREIGADSGADFLS